MTIREKLAALAANLWWSWNPEVLDLFRRLNPSAFDTSDNNPLAALEEADPALLDDKKFGRDVDTAYEAFQEYLNSSPRYADAPRVSYFCMEYGLHESLPLYAGGLGILAGDHCKAASDIGLPFTAIGFFLREGYFSQHFDGSGWQQAEYPVIDPRRHPLTLVRAQNGAPLIITVHLGRQPLYLIAWRLQVGRTTLYLLDTDFGANPGELRFLTRRLYQGGGIARIQQEIALGIGGLRLLRALGVETDVYHMNEGHCAFLTLELLRERLGVGHTLEVAEDWVREHTIFTTHTPVMAGHDRFDPRLFTEQMAAFREQLGFDERHLLSYGRVNPDDMTESFTMTVLGLKMSRQANGVSSLNGEVARRQWHHLYPSRPVDEVPIGSITNGVHLPTWTAPLARAFFDQRLGNWLERRDEAAFWQQLDKVSDKDLWQYRSTLRKTFVDYVNEIAPRQTLPQTARLDSDALTIGFARRFAPYKRATLIFRDLERLARLFEAEGRPLQIIFAGKAHPDNYDGSRLIQQIYEFGKHPALEGRVLILENYNVAVARMLISGSDVWLNNPRPPMEASGTSGQKVTVHGGLNLSILDGWWPEGYDGQNGWAIGEAEADPNRGELDAVEAQDAADAASLYHVLENEVLSAFYERGDDGLPHRWIAHMRAAMTTLPHAFSATRMVSDYVEQMYCVDCYAEAGA